MTTPECKCRWDGVVPVMVERNRACINHGDHSEWWNRVQEHARRLAEQRGAGEGL